MGRTFVGGTDVVNFGHDANYDQLSDISVGCWIKIPSTTSASGTFFNHGYVGVTQVLNTTCSLGVTGSNNAWNITYFHNYGAGLAESYEFTTLIPNDTWTYIGISRNNTTKTVTLYTAANTTLSQFSVFTYTNQPTGGTDPLVALTLGNISPAGSTGSFSSRPFIGSMCDVVYYGRNLTYSEHSDIIRCAVSQVALLLWTHLGSNPEPNISETLYSATSGVVTGTSTVASRSCPATYSPPPTGIGLITCSGILIAPITPVLPAGSDPPFPAVWPVPTATIMSRKADNMNLVMVRNNSYTFDIAVTLNGAVVDITTMPLICQAKWNYADADGLAIFKKTVGSGITVLSGPAGTARISILPADTSTLPAHETPLYFDVKLINGTDYYTIIRGVLVVKPEVTTATS